MPARTRFPPAHESSRAHESSGPGAAARGATVLVVALLAWAALATLASPASAVASSAVGYVPDTVLGSVVPAAVSGSLADDTVTLTLDPGQAGSLSGSVVSTGDDLVVRVAGVQTGLHAWRLSILSGGTTTSTTGYVLVDTRIDDLYATLAVQGSASHGDVQNVTLALRAAEKRIRDTDNATRVAVNARIGSLWAAQNATQKRVDALSRNLQANLTALGTKGLNVSLQEGPSPALAQKLDRMQSSAGGAQSSAASAQRYGLYSSAGLALVLLVLLPANAILMMQARRRRQETMVLLLALATKAGVGPDSPELQKANEILGHKPKASKPKKGKKGKAAPA